MNRTTNAIEVGPDGRLHVVVSNTLPIPETGPAARYYGGSHLYSDNGGDTWRQFGVSAPLAGQNVSQRSCQDSELPCTW